MLNALVSTENMSKEDWLEWRNKGIGGSDASVICGLNKYKSPVELWMEKTGKVEPTEAGESALWGTLLEPVIRQEFTNRTGLEVNIEKSILQHPFHPFMLANVDGIIITPDNNACIFEAKTANAFLANEWDNKIPEAYELQVQHYMAVTNFAGTYVAVLIGGSNFKWFYVKRDDYLIELLIKLERKFWECVVKNKRPKLDGSKASADLLNRLYPKGKSKTAIELPEEALILIRQYEEAHADEEEGASRKDEAINKLKEMLGDNEIGKIADYTISWSNVNKETFDSKLFKGDNPELYAKYLRDSSYRRFSIK